MPQSTGGVRPAPQFRYGEWFAQNNRNLTHPFFPAHPDAAEYPLRFSPHSTIFRVKFDRGHNSPPAITCRLGLSLVVKPHTQPTYLRAEFPPKATAPKFAAWSDCSGAGKWANSSGFVSRNPVIDGEIRFSATTRIVATTDTIPQVARIVSEGTVMGRLVSVLILSVCVFGCHSGASTFRGLTREKQCGCGEVHCGTFSGKPVAIPSPTGNPPLQKNPIVPPRPDGPTGPVPPAPQKH